MYICIYIYFIYTHLYICVVYVCMHALMRVFVCVCESVWDWNGGGCLVSFSGTLLLISFKCGLSLDLDLG